MNIDWYGVLVGLCMLGVGLSVTSSAIDDMVENNSNNVFDMLVVWASMVVDKELKALEMPLGDDRGASFLIRRRMALAEVRRMLELFKVRK